MAITRAQTVSASTGSTNATSLAIVMGNTTTGNLIVVGVSVSTSTIVIVTSTTAANITWLSAAKNQSTSSAVYLFFGIVKTGETTPTITVSAPGGTTPIAAIASEYQGFTATSGVPGARFDVRTSNSASSTALTTGTLAATPRTAAELYITAFGQRAQNTDTTTTLFSALSTNTNNNYIATNNNTANGDRSLLLLENIVVAASTTAASATSSRNDSWSAVSMTIDDTPASGASSATSRVFGG